jgi:flagellar secretion chaperone FliS
MNAQMMAYDTYTQNNVGIESSNKLVEMLYEGILRFNMRAKRAIMDDEIEKRSYWINRSIAIFTEFLSTLDMEQGDISHYLDGLYRYEIQLLSQANLQNDAMMIDEVNNVVKGLLEAWREVTNVA